MIKIKVTDEMIGSARDLAPCPLSREEMRKLIGAAARIVERDLNSVMLWDNVPGESGISLDSDEMSMYPNLCIEVEEWN